MFPQVSRRVAAWLGSLAAAWPALAMGQTEGARSRPRPAPVPAQARPLERHDVGLERAFDQNPTTSGYGISAIWRKGAIDLEGRVGTRQIHDAAVRMAIALGEPFRDRLVIDTAAAHAVADAAASNPSALAGTGSVAAGLAQSTVGAPYIYPQPLFGKVDDPFFGMTPPILSFPPWWQPANRDAIPVKPRPARDMPAQAPASAAREPFGRITAAPRAAAPEPNSVKGNIEISVDPFGNVTLRGVVASEEAARELVESARSVPGVTNVSTDFQIVPRPAAPGAQPLPAPVSPPPPPEPAAAFSPITPRPAAPAPTAEPAPRPSPSRSGPMTLDASNLSRRVAASIRKRDALAALPVTVRSNDGIVTLAGKAPSAYEAMMVYRAVQQTPGVQNIIDRLEFPVPDEDHPNPLLERGRPEDLEPYLASQIRRHLGDLAQLDRIQARGNVLSLRGTLANASDRDRVQAILRSIALLDGFKIESAFAADD